MALEQLKIREIVKQAVSKNVDIPEFQREFVWDTDQVKKLAESLYRDYPVGSFLLWDSSYIQQFRISEQFLCAHLIPESFVKVVNDEPLLQKQWSVEQYPDFLIERAQLLGQAANEFLKKLRE